MSKVNDIKPSKKLQMFLPIRKNLKTLGISQPEPMQEFHRFNLTNVAIFVFFFIFWILSWIHFFYSTNTIAEYSASAFTITSTTCTLSFYIALLWKVKTIFDVIDSFENIIQKPQKHSSKIYIVGSINPDTKQMYEIQNEKIENWSRRMDSIFVIFCPIATTFPFLITVLVEYFTKGSMDDDDFRLSYQVWLPFNWKTFPIGYTIAFGIDYAYLLYDLILCSFLFCSFVGSNWMLIAITKDIMQEFRNLNEDLKSNENREEQQKKFNETIQLHTDAKELTNGVSDFNEIMMLSFFLWGFLNTCATLLIVQSELVELSVNVMDALTKATYAFGLLFLMNEFGMQLTVHFEEIKDTIQQMDWYLFPIEIQRMLPTIIQFAQQPAEIVTYGNIPVNRDTFKRIVNSGFSYFMIFREF